MSKMIFGSFLGFYFLALFRVLNRIFGSFFPEVFFPSALLPDYSSLLVASVTFCPLFDTFFRRLGRWEAGVQLENAKKPVKPKRPTKTNETTKPTLTNTVKLDLFMFVLTPRPPGLISTR